VGLCLCAPALAAQHPLSPADYEHLVSVTEPQISPDGESIAYLVTTIDHEADETRTAVWLTNWQASEQAQLTRGESASEPRFSPDGKYLSFLSARPSGSPAQVWLLDRHGGEARQLTHVTGEIARYEWSPDGHRLVIALREKPPQPPPGAKPSAETAPKPIVIDTWHFKGDIAGYLTTSSHTHLSLVDVGNGDTEALTSTAEYNDDLPAWSPDGKLIAYVSNHRADAERSGVNEIYLIEPHSGATARKLAEVYSPDRQRVAFSPDGRTLLLLQGDQPRFNAYINDRLAVVSVDSGRVRTLTEKLDRAVSNPIFSSDGRSVGVIVEDDRAYYPALVSLESGGLERRVAGPVAVRDEATAAGHTVVLASSDAQPSELYALEDGKLRKLTSQTDPWLADVALGEVRDIRFNSKDGTDIHGLMVLPPGYTAGRRYPTILWIHGGPNGQDAHELMLRGSGPPLERQLLAARGYVVLGINYRGSSGRGGAFARSILADWGHKEVEDLHAAIDYVVAQKIADPERLGIGGWSYGGILTDYSIASDTRFKAAISGASTGNQLEMFGIDQYALQWNWEIGPPWQRSALYSKLSYPLLHADRIRTPTLFLGGDKDFNVPLAGAEQMYFALRTLNVPTELIVYPGQFHSLARPSFFKDRAERYVAWFGKYLPPTP
jgi:dipeptidyl aminopeptidase/acylaminoacyl peptidase